MADKYWTTYRNEEGSVDEYEHSQSYYEYDRNMPIGEHRTGVDYKFREDELIREFSSYIDQTYGGHYGQGGLQSSEVIVDRGHGIGFFLGNVDKYNGRYGKKGSPADHRKDLMKIIHYGFLALYEHDRLNEIDSIEE